MISVDSLALFFMASLVLGLVPGPDNLFVLTQSALRGKIAGLFVTLGLCTGLVVHTTAVAFGVAVIFQASTVAFTALKLFGSGYLLYLAWHAFRTSAKRITAEKRNELNYGKLYRRGIIMNVTNPKVSIFFLAFLPQFANPIRGSLTTQMLLLGGVFIGSTIIVFGSIALLAGASSQWLNQTPRTQVVMNRLAGTVFVGLALKLATADR